MELAAATFGHGAMHDKSNFGLHIKAAGVPLDLYM